MDAAPPIVSNRQAASQAVSSQVLREPLGQLVGGALLLGGGLLLLVAGVAGWAYSRLIGGMLLLLGVALLVVAWRLATGSTQPLLLTLSPEALRLSPLGLGLTPGSTAETIPLTSVVAYTHWLSRGRVVSRYYLRLKLADGRVLRLADLPGGPLGEPGSAVPLPDLVAQLARWKVPPAGT